MLYGCIYRNCSYWFSIKAALWADAKADFKKVIKGWNHVRHVRSVCVCVCTWQLLKSNKSDLFYQKKPSSLVTLLQQLLQSLTGHRSMQQTSISKSNGQMVSTFGSRGSLWRDKDSSVRGCSTIGVHQVNVNMTRPHFFIIHPCVSSWNYKTLAFPQIYSPSEE